MYDLCLTCCRELRAGNHPGGENADSARLHLKEDEDLQDQDQDDNLSPDPSQLVNEEVEAEKSSKQSVKTSTPPETLVNEGNIGTELVDSNRRRTQASDIESMEVPAESMVLPPWTAQNGEIPCPPELRGGCGKHMLGLRTLFEPNWLENIISQAEGILKSDDAEDMTELHDHICPCNGLTDESSPKVRLAAHREDGRDNYLYCPTYSEAEKDGSSHFQKHWRQGHPVIVRNVDEGSTGLSWEPMVMWRAVREITGSRRTFKEDTQSAYAVDCADWNEVRERVT